MNLGLLAPGTLVALLILTPLIGALLVSLTGRWPNLRETVTLLTAATLFGLATQLIDPVVNGDGASLVVAEPIPGLSIAFDVEPLGLVFSLLASLLWFVTSVYAIGYVRGIKEQRQTSFFAFFAIAICGAMGVATAGNLLTLFIFYEVLTLSTWPLVTHKRTGAARAGGRTYLGVLMVTSIGLLLPAIIWTWVVAGTTDFTPGGILIGRINPTAAAILLTMFVLGVGKAAVMPMHRWLPAAMVAPTPVSALLHAVAVVKAGVFTITKVVIYIFGIDFLAAVPMEKYLVYLAGFTVVAASIVALKQVELKRMLAYSTIGHIGFIMLGVIAGTADGYAGVLVYMTIYLFMSMGAFAVIVLMNREGIQGELLDDFAGLSKVRPGYALAMGLYLFSLAGIPFLGGFWAKYVVFMAAIEAGHLYLAIIALLFSVVGAFYYIRVVKYIYFDETRVAFEFVENRLMQATVAVTAVAVVAIGLYPQPVINICKAALGGII